LAVTTDNQHSRSQRDEEQKKLLVQTIGLTGASARPWATVQTHQ